MTSSVKASGRPPTLDEIATHLGVSSNNTVRTHLMAIEKKGYLSRMPGARGIRVLKNGGRR